MVARIKVQGARGKGQEFVQTVSPYVLTWLQQSVAVSVLHSFDQACNLINQDGEIVSLVTPRLGNGPFAMVVDADSFANRVDVETAVSVTPTSITVGNLTVDLTNVSLWNPHPNWADLQKKTTCPRADVGAVWSPKINLIKKMVDAHRPKPDGMMSILQQQLHYAQQQFTHAILPYSGGFYARPDLENSCPSESNHPPEGDHKDALQDAVCALAGLGNGLTPAGDDFLMGALYGLWATEPESVVKKLGEMVMETAVLRTTTLSAAWLRAAAKGEAIEPWHKLCEALLRDGEWETAVSHILAIGHSSGADALTGFLAIINKLQGVSK